MLVIFADKPMRRIEDDFSTLMYVTENWNFRALTRLEIQDQFITSVQDAP
jgi:hypothetical protein